MGWQKSNKYLVKNFSFSVFSQAMQFVNKVAEIAERLDHHPEIFIHDYNQVQIKTTTHKEGKVTQKDYDLALHIDSI